MFFAAGALAVDPWLKTAGEPALGTLGAALAYGLAVAAMTEIAGPVSGGHLNPAISLGAWATRRMGTWRLLGYALAQLAGAVAAAVALLAYKKALRPGVPAPEELPPERVLPDLSARGITFEIRESTA